MKKRLIISLIVLAFLIGFLSSYFLNFMYIDVESPFFVGVLNNNTQPGNWLSEKDIEIFPDKVVLNIKNAFISKFADTGSMLPTLGEDSNGIKIKPESASQINIGDIITYKDNDILIVHRVVDKGEDEKGVYFITKGDNNAETDRKVYWEQVEYVTVALIY